MDDDDLRERLPPGADLEREVRLLTGADPWSLHPEPAVGLRRLVVSDGPAGVRGERWDERDTAATVPSLRLQEEGVGATAEHLVANDQGTERFSADVRVDERVLREVYLAPFEAIVREGGVWGEAGSRWATEAGRFRLHVGPSSGVLPLRLDVQVPG